MSKREVLAPSIIKDIVAPWDIDYLGHMNNARYFRYFEYGRTDFWLRNGAWDKLKQMVSSKSGKKGDCFCVMGSVTCRFRKELKLGQTFQIRTEIICWDDKTFFMEQRLERNGFVHAVALLKQVAIGTTPQEIINFMGLKETSPEMPPRVKEWISYDNLSSELLRSEAGLYENSPKSSNKKIK